MTQPWYKQFWPWFLIALPGSVVIASIITIIIAAHDPDGLVNDDYYKQGLLINRTLAKEQQTRKLALSIDLQGHNNQLRFKLYSHRQLLPQQNITVALSHPTRASRDQIVTASYDTASESYVIPLQVNQGNWQLVIEPKQGDWRISQRIRLPVAERYTVSY
jgi:hypothetical protein